MTTVSVFRPSGVQRSYGFGCDNVVHVVWRDPLRQIWPGRTKRT